MIKDLNIPIERDRLWMDENVVYEQVPGWCGHVTHNLRMSVIYHDVDFRHANYPCVVWVTGGGWKWVDVQAYLPNLVDIAQAGYVLASVEYQCSNDAVFPEAIKQIKSAVRYLRTNAERYRINSNCIGIMGESSGGYLASMVGLTNGNSLFESGSFLNQSSSVQAVCSWYTPTMLETLAIESSDTSAELDQNLGELLNRFLNVKVCENLEKAREADPLFYIKPPIPPFLLLHGTKDTLVPIECTERLYMALQKAGAEVDYYRIRGADHADYPFFQPKLMALVTQFFNKYLT